ncbi:chloride channel protein, CIC family [Paenimyroides aquimaris]|uniref:Chloride channel protein, CIC family n=1 Tax=Paenimyroides marinum TaxID=1159016 RepID=A0A1H6K790_9FLAO|nr:chloride channel protein [Paenimyroides aquimaris]SEH68315.1 chloride channel protein, CIC family [Paenimyroides aquimaris]
MSTARNNTKRLKKTFRYLEGILYLLKTIISERQFLYVSCVLVGVSSALAVILLKTFAHSVFQFATYVDTLLKLPFSNSILPIIGILLTVFVIKKFLDGSIEKGTSQIMIAVAKRSGFMPRKQMFAQIITSSLTVGMGGSAGLESPITITGAAFGSNFAQNFRFNYKDRTLLLACGVASGIAAAFNAPIAGVLFAIEVILADMSVTAFIPLMISSATGAIVSGVVLKESVLLNFKSNFTFDYSNIIYYVLVGIAAGFFSIYHARMFRKIEHFTSHLPYKIYKKAFVGAGMLAVLIFLFPTLFGEGYESIKSLANNDAATILENSLLEKFNQNPWIVLIFVGLTAFIKSIATGLTLGSGGNGGNFAPSLFVGSYLGYVIAKFIELIGLKKLPIENFTVVGMAAVLSGLFHSPLTAIFLIAEITGGYGLMVPLLIVSSISFAISKRYDNYSMDIFTIADKGLVFTSDKDKNILNKIELHTIYNNSIESVTVENSMYDVKNLFLTTDQTFIPVVNEDRSILGIIYFKEVRDILFNHYKLNTTLIANEMKPALSVSLSENTGNVVQLMDENHLTELLVTQHDKLIGFVTKVKILEVYRENLKNLRIE